MIDKNIEYTNSTLIKLVNENQANKEANNKLIEELRKITNEESIKKNEELEQKINSDDTRYEKNIKTLNNLIQADQNKIDTYHAQIKNIHDQLTQILPADVDLESLTVETRVAQLQMSYFLKRAGLSADIIPLGR